MDKKNSKPPGKNRRPSKRMKKGEGDVRARQRSFMKQRTAVLRTDDEQGREAAERPLEQDEAAPPAEGHQEQVAEYRRRQQKSADRPRASKDED